MAKDTEKLIRELSLISFLMAERRPVSALEIKRDVEGYSEMNDDAFARRFYADRAELESLGIKLRVEKPSDGYFEAELYTLPPENFYLQAIEFTNEELAALQTALSLLDGTFAYAEPLRLALQQLTWGRPSPLSSPEQRSVAVSITGEAGGRDLSQRLAKIETAISRRKRIEFAYYTMERDSEEKRRVDPYHLIFRSGQFYMVGYSHERDGIRVFRLSRIRGKVSYATKAEHDFQVPDDFEPGKYANRIEWQFGDVVGTAEIWISDRIAWLVERDFSRFGSVRPVESRDRAPGPGIIFETDFASARPLISWVLGLRDNARIRGPKELVEEAGRRISLLVDRHYGGLSLAKTVKRNPKQDRKNRAEGKSDTQIRPERFARLVTLASILIDAAKQPERLKVADVCQRLQLTDGELADDISLLNVVNFGGGSYMIYAEIIGEEIEVDPQPYGDSFARPARLLPLEAKALIAAIDILGDHIPAGSLASSREKIVAALGEDPSLEGLQVASTAGSDSVISRTVNRAIIEQRLLKLLYYKPNEDEYTTRKVEPYALINGIEGWYLVTYDLDRGSVRHFRLDRIKEAKALSKKFEPREDVDPTADLEGWPRTGRLPEARSARVWISRERARWAKEGRAVIEELADGSVIIELPFAGTRWLVREILKEAGDAAVLEPEDARELVLATAKKMSKPRRRRLPKKQAVPAQRVHA